MNGLQCQHTTYVCSQAPNPALSGEYTSNPSFELALSPAPGCFATSSQQQPLNAIHLFTCSLDDSNSSVAAFYSRKSALGVLYKFYI